MSLLKNNFFKRIIVSSSIVILLVFFCMSPVSHASKLKMGDGEFYYAGTTKGSYVVTEGVFSWLLSKIGEIADFLLGIMTMGGRMVFVGWTALFEKVLTWVLEASTGVEMDVDKLNATSVEENTNSSDNITIEAIVYNQVPIFNINFFKEEEVRRCVSGTGRFVVECKDCADPKDKKGLCRMRVCSCDTCKAILDEKYNNNVISVVRENVMEWYSVIRYTAIVAMLCLLLVLGIKMGISSVAQDKAMYKRMIVDWLVGMILLFSIHYIMVVIVNFNESMVDIIKNVETGVTEVTKKELHYEEKSDDELEISIYEAVRTRAYDAKLINGTTGMIMYITLVFYAFRFSFVYFKRFLTMIVLTLMAPGVGLAYAFQKAMTGKSKSFSKWLHEYFVNAIIQTIHALLYTSFVSTALVISLNSVSGMIFALVIMNFMLKADKIFRKVFKLSEGGSLAENTLDKSDPKQLVQSMQSAATFMAGGKLMQKSPITKAIKAPLRAVKTGAMRVAININEKYNETHGLSEEEKVQNQINKSKKLKKIADIAMIERRRLGGTAKKEFTDYMKNFKEEEDIISLDGEDAIEKELDSLEQDAYIQMENAETQEDYDKAKKIYDNVQKLKGSFDNQTNLTTGQVFKAHLDQILDRNNYYDYDATKTKGKRYSRGKMVYDPVKNKMVKRRMADLISEQMTLKNMLGMTEKDEKLLKETTGLIKGTLVGMGSMFVGLGTIVSDPLIGMGLLANGVASSYKYLDAVGYYDNNKDMVRVVSDKNKRYSFNRFGKGAKQTITKVIKGQAEGEKDRAVVENVKENHTKLYKSLKLGGMGLKVVGSVTATAALGGISVGAAPVVIAATTAYATTKRNESRFNLHGQNALIGRMEKNHFKQYKDLRKQLVKDEIQMLSVDEKEEYKDNYTKLIESIVVATSIKENTTPEQEKQQQKLDIEAGNAVETKDGQVVSISTHAISNEAQLIDQATAEVLVSQATDIDITDEMINSDKTMDDVQKVIELKLKAQGKLADGTELKIGDIKDLKGKIKSSARKLVKEMEGEHQSKDEDGKPIVSLLDSALIQQVVKEQLATTDLKDISQIDPEKITAAVEEKKKAIISKQATKSVTEQIQGLKELIQNRESILPGMDIEKAVKMSEQLEKWKFEQKALEQRQGIIATGDKTFVEKTQVSQEAKNAIESTLTQIRQPIAVVSDPERNKKQEKQQVDTLKALLEGAAKGVNDNNQVKINNEVKSVDEVVKQLFANTEQQETTYELVENISRMRRLNKRGNSMKMKSRDHDYTQQKREKDNARASNFETYGPVTNIIDLIKQTDSEMGKK